jgi:hypothetical protein
MKISGFTIAKNASKLYYPLKEAIQSVLPLCDEFVVALGKGDEDDISLKLINEIGSTKIKIVDTVWDVETYRGGAELARQTNIAKDHCTGDWLFYIQSDEMIHEKDYDHILENCRKYLNDKSVEGFLFKYLHFWGDYQHIQDSHTWYRKEIRIIRNDKQIYSWRDAQSFRRIPNFEGKDFMTSEGTSKLHVIELNAHIFHYGWVRPPSFLTKKVKAFKETKYGQAHVANIVNKGLILDCYDYGNLKRLSVFKGTHPKLMDPWIEKMNWKDQLRFSGPETLNIIPDKHNKMKYRIISFIEKYFLFGRRLGEFKNYIKVQR